MLAIIFSVALLLPIMVAVYRELQSRLNATWKSTFAHKRVLLVTAHPDDEVMFFGPTMTNLCNFEAQMSILCLSEGNWRHAGSQRKVDMAKALAIVSRDLAREILVKFENFADSPEDDWNLDLVRQKVASFVQQNEIDFIITFDSSGISGHTNHIACHNAISSPDFQSLIAIQHCRLFQLVTPHLVCKYLPLEIVGATLYHSLHVSCSSRKIFLTTDWAGWWTLILAMAEYSTEFVWFRKLYMIFSQLTWANTLVEIQPSY